MLINLIDDEDELHKLLKDVNINLTDSELSVKGIEYIKNNNLDAFFFIHSLIDIRDSIINKEKI